MQKKNTSTTTKESLSLAPTNFPPSLCYERGFRAVQYQDLSILHDPQATPQGWQTNSLCLHDTVPPYRHSDNLVQHYIFSVARNEQIALKLVRELSVACMVSFSEIHVYRFRLLGVATIWLLRENDVTSCLFS